MKNLRDDEKYVEFIQLTEAATGSSPTVLKRHQLANTDDSSNHYKQLYFEVLDNIITQLQTRFSRCEELLFLKLGETKNFALYEKEFPNDALNSLMNTYGNLFDKEKLGTELQTIIRLQRQKEIQRCKTSHVD